MFRNLFVKRSIFTVGLTIIMVFGLLLPAYGRSLSDIRTDKKQKKTEIKNIQQNIQDNKAQIMNLSNEIDKLDVEKTLKEEELQNLGVKINKNEVDLQKAEDDLIKRRDVLGERLKNIYEDGSIGYIEVLLGAKDFSDFVNRFEFLKEIISSDNKLIDSIKEKKAFIENKKAELLQQRDQAEATKVDLQNNINIRETKQNELEQQIKLNLEAAKKAAQELNKLEDEEENEIARRARAGGGGAFQGEGQFIWPVPISYNHISSGFGPRRSPVPGASSYHKGVDIPVPIGTPVAATQAGTILYSTTMSGYGNVVWVDHGGGIVSVYGHLSRFNVSQGQHVNKGDIIAFSGNTGVSSGPHVHFEIRVNGEARNPLGYVKVP